MDSYATENNSPIRVSYTTEQEYLPRSERNNRIIKETIRAIYDRIPFIHLPKIMIKYLVTEIIRKLNYFPNKNRISNYYSSRMILH